MLLGRLGPVDRRLRRGRTVLALRAGTRPLLLHIVVEHLDRFVDLSPQLVGIVHPGTLSAHASPGLPTATPKTYSPNRSSFSISSNMPVIFPASAGWKFWILG